MAAAGCRSETGSGIVRQEEAGTGGSAPADALNDPPAAASGDEGSASGILGQGEGKAPALANVEDITPDSGYYMSPRWSPDGTRVAATTADFKGIAVIDPDTRGMQVVTDEAGAGFKFAWSPGGRKIVYLAQGPAAGGSVTSLVRLDLHSMEEKVLLRLAGDMGFPVYSADGKAVFLTVGRRLVRIDEELGHVFEITPEVDARTVQVAEADGTAVFDEGGRVIAASLEKNEERRVLFSGEGFFSPILSADAGMLIVYESRGPEGHIWVYDMRQREKRDLGVGYGGVFHPGGDWIVFELSRDDGHTFLEGDIWIMRPDGSAKTRLTDTRDVIEMYPAFSPDGRRLAYTDQATGRIFVADMAFE
ncbi:MAG: hypothetical protein ABIJ56_12795 [Pseudomonadota bacterium]